MSNARILHDGTRDGKRQHKSHGAHPQARSLESERTVLGSPFSEPSALATIRRKLQTRDFGYEPHQWIYERMCIRADRGEPYTDDGLLANDLCAFHGMKREDAIDLTSRLAYAAIDKYHAVEKFCQEVLKYAIVNARVKQSEWSAGALLPDADEEDIAREMAALDVRIADIKQRMAGSITGASTSLADVEDECFDWLWYGRLARRKPTLLDGDPGVGKGLTITEIIACLTTGRPLPGDTARREPQDVLLLSPEDGAGDTLKPRLRVAGADVARVHVLGTYRDAHGNERDVTFPSAAPIIEAEARRVNACLLVVDPIMACLDGGVKTSDDTQVRAALRPLVRACEATNMALLMVRHMNKSGDGKALYRGGGSIAFTGLARILMLMTEHPDDAGGGDKRVALAVSKINIIKTPPTLGLAIHPISEDPNIPPRIVWDDEPLHFTADELLNASNTKQSQERRDVIRAIADAQRPLTVVEIAEACGIAPDRDALEMNTLRQRIMRMEKSGQILRVDRGVYSLPSLSSPNKHNNNNKDNNRNKHNITVITNVTPITENVGVTNASRSQSASAMQAYLDSLPIEHTHDFSGPMQRPNGPRQCLDCPEYGYPEASTTGAEGA